MAPETRFAKHGDVSIAYETFGDTATGVPLLGIMGLDFQMVWWPDAFCAALVERGFAVARFDNRDAGLSTHFASGRKESPWRALMGGTKPAYTTLDMLDDALAVMDALGWPSAHVMGGSMGAGLAQALAVYHPDRVRSVISCMGLPADASPLRLLGYIHFGKFLEFRRLKTDGSRESQIELLGIRLPGHRLAWLPVPRAVGARDGGDLARPQPVRSHVDPAPARGRAGAEDPAYCRDHRAHAGHLRRGRPADQAQGRAGHRGPHPGRPVRRVSGYGPQPARGTLAADYRRDLRGGGGLLTRARACRVVPF